MLALVPPIGAKGSFKLAPPYDTITKEDQEYTVTGVRSLIELENSGEKPFDTIYATVGLTEVDFKSDLDNNIPVVILTTSGGEYIYIPAGYIESIPKIIGVKYQEVVLAISLGNIPVDTDLTTLKTTIIDDVEAISGIISNIKEVPASAVTLVPDIKHTEYQALLANRKTVFKSYLTKYLETLELLNKRNQVIAKLEEYIKTL